jgi:hypothetical protein
MMYKERVGLSYAGHGSSCSAAATLGFEAQDLISNGGRGQTSDRSIETLHLAEDWGGIGIASHSLS